MNEAMMKKEGKVMYTFEGVPSTKVAQRELGRLIMERKFHPTDVLGVLGCAMYGYMKPEDVGQAFLDLRAYRVTYSGPTYFDNSTIFRRYESGEDELEGKYSQRYLDYLARGGDHK